MSSIETCSLLRDRTVLSVTGSEARDFLQGLITNDIRKVTRQDAIFTALLTPQGKFLHDFFIIEYNKELLLDVATIAVGELEKRLSMYKLRRDVSITHRSQLQVGAFWGAHPARLDNCILYKDPRLVELGMRVIGENLPLPENGAYDIHRLSLAVPEGYLDLIPNRSLPMEWGYDKLNAISFDKGCYVGQEVTARSKHRATLRKTVYAVTADAPLPPIGTPVMAEIHEVGHMASSKGKKGLAIVNIEAVQSGKVLLSQDITLKATLPDWNKEEKLP